MGFDKGHQEFHKLDLSEGWHTPPGYPAGIQQKIIAGELDEVRKQGNRTRLLRFQAGTYTTAPFVHEYWEEVFLLSGDLIVTKVERDAALLQITAVQARAPTEGQVVLTFGDKPMQLRRWTVIDGRNRAISITLTNLKTGGALKDDLFVFNDPDPNRAGRFRP